MDSQQPPLVTDSSSAVNFATRARRVMTGFLPWVKSGQQVADSSDEQFLPIVDFVPAPGQVSGDAVTRIAAARALPGFDETRRLIVEAIAFRADRLTLETTTESTAWFDVDGVRLKPSRAERGGPQGGQWKELEPLRRDTGIAVAQVLRTLSGLPDSSIQQAGVFGLTIDRVPCLGQFAAARSVQGERITVEFMTNNRFPVTLQDAGIAESMIDRLAKLVDQDHGLLLLSSPPGQGLTTSLDLLVEASDRFLRDFVAIAGRGRPGREIVNLATMRYGHKDAPTAVELLKTAIIKNVGVIVAPDVRDKDFVVELVKMAATKAMVLMSIKAADASEAVTRLMKCGVDPKAFGAAFRGSLSQRLVRRLCPRCRVQTEPPAAFRSGAGGSGEQVANVFTAARHGCKLCCGVGYRGRTGVFELATGDTLRRVILSGGGFERLRQAALKDGMQPLRHTGLQLVAEGTTSLEEIDRGFSPIPCETESQSGRE